LTSKWPFLYGNGIFQCKWFVFASIIQTHNLIIIGFRITIVNETCIFCGFKRSKCLKGCFLFMNHSCFYDLLKKRTLAAYASSSSISVLCVITLWQRSNAWQGQSSVQEKFCSKQTQPSEYPKENVFQSQQLGHLLRMVGKMESLVLNQYCLKVKCYLTDRGLMLGKDKVLCRINSVQNKHNLYYKRIFFCMCIRGPAKSQITGE
jgi:hypothetical protein